MKWRPNHNYKKSSGRLQWEREAGIPDMSPGERLKMCLHMSDFCIYLEAGGKQNLRRASALYHNQSASVQRIWEDEACRVSGFKPFQKSLKLLQAAK